MAATYRSIDTETVGGTSSITLSAPAGAVSGDTLWAFISIRGTYTITGVPSGWTLYDSIDGGGLSDPFLLIYYHSYAGTGSPWTWTRSSSTGTHAAACVAVYDDDSASVTAYSENDTGSGTSHAATSVTAADGDLLFTAYSWFVASSTTTWTYDGGGSEVCDIQGTGGTVRLGLALYHDSPSAGATGSITGTASQSSSGVAVNLSLAGAALGDPVKFDYYTQMRRRN